MEGPQMDPEAFLVSRLGKSYYLVTSVLTLLLLLHCFSGKVSGFIYVNF